MNIKYFITVVFFGIITSTSLSLSAKENVNTPSGNNNSIVVKNNKVAAGCNAPTKTMDLDINNVRAKILNSSDFWWDIFGSGNSAYEIPKSEPGTPENPSSLFAGSVWIGGIDPANNLRVAAQTYRQNGVDFWPGPLDKNGQIDAVTCKQFDRFWKITSADLSEFKKNGSSNIPQNVLEYPGKGNPNLPFIGNRDLAPFHDTDGDGTYNPSNGDYPILSDSFPNANPDMILWWVFNDKGNVHNESGSEPIGLEIHAQAFAFQKNSAENDMTFYRYFIINKATTTLSKTYMGFWTDADLGDAADDFVGCDTTLGLGICYNGDAVDGPANPLNYGDRPPLVGVDYFQGPRGDDGKLLGMSSFVYFNNDNSAQGNPGSAQDFYNYMQAKWRDNNHVTFGGTGYSLTSTQYTNYMFPSDPKEAGAGVWSECLETNAPADRRFVQASGPFTLLPGATNDVIVGVPWVRPPAGTYPCPSFDLLRKADKIAQALFDNKFEIIKGPPAPGFKIVELDQELILTVFNYKETEDYKKADVNLRENGIPDSFFVFEGYRILQVSPDGNSTKLLFNVDLKNNVTQIINWPKDNITGAYNGVVHVSTQESENKGIRHTFRITEDAFAQTSQRTLINFKSYKFRVVPYAYNNWNQFNPDNPTTGAQDQPYLEGTPSEATGIPHKTLGQLMSSYNNEFEITRMEGQGNGGNELDITSESISKILTGTAYSLGSGLKYQKGKGPISVKIIDPLKVQDADYELIFDTTAKIFYTSIDGELQIGDTIIGKKSLAKGIIMSNNGFVMNITKAVGYFQIGETIKKSVDNSNAVVYNFLPKSNVSLDSANWFLINKSINDTFYSEKTITNNIEQVTKWGISVSINQVKNPGSSPEVIDNGNGLISSSITYSDPSKKWLTGVGHNDAATTGFNTLLATGQIVYRWIRSGEDSASNTDMDYKIGSEWLDPKQFYENLIDGTWAPYRLCRNSANTTSGPGWNDAQFTTHNTPAAYKLDSISSVNIVYTSDKSKWTRCVVIELGFNSIFNEGNQQMHTLREHPSVDKNGVDDGTGTMGMSWFPGYAINVETGERLNIMFGEDSDTSDYNGNYWMRDLIWNPTAETTKPDGTTLSPGGKHYVYVLRSKYDSCNAVYASYINPSIDAPSLVERRKIYQQVMWVSMPYIAPGFKLNSLMSGLIPNDVTIKLRVEKPYGFYSTTGENNGLPKYKFSTSGSSPNLSTEVLQKSLDLIKVVPNPYYSFSMYESSSADKKIKITNLPKKCIITIYSINGALIKQIKRDNSSNTYEDWNLTNFAGVPISSGVYIIHINAEGLGEKTLKWFGVMRPADLANF